MRQQQRGADERDVLEKHRLLNVHGLRIVSRGGPDREMARTLVLMFIDVHTRWRGLLASLRQLVFTDETVRRFHRAQRKRQLDWMAELRAQRNAPPHRREQDIVYLYATERTFDGIAHGELQALGLKRKLVIDAMVERTIAALRSPAAAPQPPEETGVRRRTLT